MYNDLRMRVVAVDKYMAAKSVVLSTEDRQVVGQGCLPLSSTRSSPCSQQLALLALFTATGKLIWPIIHLSGLFTYPAWFSYFLGQRGPDNRGSTVTVSVTNWTEPSECNVFSPFCTRAIESPCLRCYCPAIGPPESLQRV